VAPAELGRGLSLIIGERGLGLADLAELTEIVTP
jgi:hypothetical protein